MDAVAGLITVLLKGDSGNAYNIADESGDIMLKDLASIIAGYADRKVVLSCRMMLRKLDIVRQLRRD